MTVRNIFNMVDTWNNGSTVFNAIKMTVTDTASDPASNLINLISGSTQMFTVSRVGDGWLQGGLQTGGIVNGLTGLMTGGTASLQWTGRTKLQAPGDGHLLITTADADDVGFLYFGETTSAWPALLPLSNDTSLRVVKGDNSGFADLHALNITAHSNLILNSSQPEIRMGPTGDVVLQREDAGILSIVHGTNAQTLNLYKTWTDGSNYELMSFGWDGSANAITSRALGSGTTRPLALMRGSTTHWFMSDDGNLFGAHLLPDTDNTFDIGAPAGAKPRNIYAANSIVTPFLGIVNLAVDHNSPPFQSFQTWNGGSNVFTAFQISVTDTASGATSLLTDLTVGGTSKFKVDKSGNTTMSGALISEHVEIKDSITAPTATSGKAKLFVDQADGSLKVIFGDGTVQTLATNP